MKKTLSLLLLMAVAMMATSKPVDPQRAVQVAKNFVAQKTGAADGITATVAYTHLQPQSGLASMYAVNFTVEASGVESQQGFVLVAADDVAHPVLGYNFGRQWPTSATKRSGEAVPMAAHVTEFLDGFASQIEAAASSQSTASDADSTLPERKAGTSEEWMRLSGTDVVPLAAGSIQTIGPLITTTWDQSPYYNAMCPEDASGEGGHALTGCVATSMAQVIKFWSYPEHGRGSHTYTEATYGNQSVNFANATYDYAHMPTELTGQSSAEEVNAVAQLMYHCGVAADMAYGTGGSSSYDIVARVGLINFFRYSPNIRYEEKALHTEDEWNAILRAEVDAGRPMMYFGSRSRMGHSFICDGYKSDGTFHFNFGWSGHHDGWYLTSAVNPGFYTFNENQSVLIGIEPNPTGNVFLAQMSGTSNFTVDEPLEVYHLLGHNDNPGYGFGNPYTSSMQFVSPDPNQQLVLDIIEYANQTVSISDGQGGSLLRTLTPGSGNDLTPITSTSSSFCVDVQGRFLYAGFKFSISPDDGDYHTVNVYASDGAMGAVSGGGRFHSGISARIKATPADGYYFVRWSDGNTENPREVRVNDDVELTAIFAVTLVTYNLRCCTGQTLVFAVDEITHTATVTGHVGSCTGALIVPPYVSIDGVRYDVRAIGERAFQGCTDLTMVTLPVSITTVGEGAFSGCTSITDIIIL